MALRRIELPDGRVLALDDVGDPRGVPVVYLHGTPDSRLARHPDDSRAAAVGVRLLAIDRPGAGDSPLDPVGDHGSLGRDVTVVLDALGIDEVGLLGWSSGGLAALGVAAVLGRRVGSVALVAALPPAEAYADPVVKAALGPSRRPLVDLLSELTPAEVAAEVAAFLVPMPLTPDLAMEHVLEGAGDVGRSELAAVPGAADALAAGLQAGVAAGLAGVEQDLRLQLTPGLDLTAITAPVATVHGELDGVSPPAVGDWIISQLPSARAEAVAGGAHHLVFTLWDSLLRTAAGGSKRLDPPR